MPLLDAYNLKQKLPKGQHDRVIGETLILVGLYEGVDLSKPNATEARCQILFEIRQSLKYWFKKSSKEKLPNKSTSANDLLNDLLSEVEAELKATYDVGWFDSLDKVLMQNFGRSVDAAYLKGGVNADDTSKYISTASEQNFRKICFRDGETFQWSYETKGIMGFTLSQKKSTLTPFTTAGKQSKSGPGWAIFVMAASGRIYAESYSRGGFHHSYFLNGESVYSAGEIKIDDGQQGGKIVGLTNLSGHYKPDATQMSNVLVRLRNYGVDLGNLQVWQSARRPLDQEVIRYLGDEMMYVMTGTQYLQRGGPCGDFARIALGSPMTGDTYQPGSVEHGKMVAAFNGAGVVPEPGYGVMVM